MKVLNAFSLNMLAQFPAAASFEEIPTEATAWALWGHGIESCVVHADTATVFSSVLGVEVPCNRVSVTLAPGETALVCQYTGPRLSEGATTLPEGALVKWALMVYA